MMSTTTSDILTTLSGKTKTLGWDAVVAYDRNSINHLLEQQYVSRLAAGTHFPPVSWSNTLDTLRLENVTLGTPLVSFENATILNSRAMATLEFTDGTISELNTFGQVTRHTRLRPGMGYGLKLSVDLTAGQGSVDQEGKVLIDFSQGTITVVEGINEPPAELLSYFSAWLASTQVIYEVGQISPQAMGTGLTPQNFIIRTQPASDAAETGNGAALLFVATEVTPAGGTMPTSTYPWLIPDTHSSTILINGGVILENYVKPTLDRELDTGEWELKRGAGSDEAYYLLASDDATINSGNIRVETNEGGQLGRTWSGSYSVAPNTEVHQDFIYSLKGAELTFDGSGLKMSFDSNTNFDNPFGYVYWDVGATGGSPGYYWTKGTVNFNSSGEASYVLTVNEDQESIVISLQANNSTTSSNFGTVFPHGAGYMVSVLHARLKETQQLSSDILTAVPFNDISVFAVNHILFPEQNINTLQAVYAPGDLAIFGEISLALTSLVVEPLTTTLPAGGSVQFTSNTTSSVSWSLSPAEAGSISASGLYQAPATTDTAVLPVTVTATTASGLSASVHITVVPSSVLVSPAFYAMDESNLRNLQLTATVLGGNTLTGWTLDSTEAGLEGSITTGGLYTPPDIYPDSYPYGYTVVTATATATDGSSARAYILLVNENTSAEFSVTPSLTTNMAAGGQLELSAKATLDFAPDSWSLYPQSGRLSAPVAESGTYTVTYTAPDTVSGDGLVIISTEQSGKPHRAGYAVVDIANREQGAWSLIDGVSTLRVVTEAGGGSAQLYKNNVQQAAVVVQFTG
jgi:hypothetical protein